MAEVNSIPAKSESAEINCRRKKKAKDRSEARHSTRRAVLGILAALALFVCAAVGAGLGSNAADVTGSSTASAGFSVANVISSIRMFYGDGKIVGGNGTTYSSSNITADYANIDKDEDPGYFSEYNAVAYAVYSSDGSLAFYYRSQEQVPSRGDTYEGKTVVSVYTGVDTTEYTSSDEVPWSGYASDITSVEVVDTVSPISTRDWFYGLENCTSMDLTNLDTSNVTNMNNMFYGCSSLTGLVLTSFDTSNVTNMSGMFYGCSGLKSLGISRFDTSNVTTMSSMFYGCSSLVSLSLGNFDTSNVTAMSFMFAYCSNLRYVYLTSFDTSNVTTMANMFQNCTSLTTLDLSNFDTANVTLMNSMFNHCESLKTLDVSSFDTAKVTTMASMFFYCESLTSLDLSNFDTGNVTNMNTMFRNCYALETLDVSNFDTTNVTNIGSMFNHCESLKTLDVSSFDVSKVTDLGGVFANMTSLTSLDVSGFETSSATTMGGMFQYDSSLKTIYAGYDWDLGNLTTNGLGMFTGCTSLVGGNGTAYDSTVAGSGNAGYANIDGSSTRGAGYFTKKTVFAVYSATDNSLTFYSQTSKPSVGSTYNGKVVTAIFTGFDTTRYTSASSVPWTSYKSSIKTVTVSDSFFATSTAYWFYGFTNCTSMDLRKLYTVEVTDMLNMFYNCKSLTTIYVGNGWNTDSVTTSTNMFYGCTSVVGENGTSFNNIIGYDASMAIIDGGPDSDTPGYLSSTPIFAVYSEDDGSLTFYYRSVVPTTGDTYKRKTVTAVFNAVTATNYTSASSVPWYEYRNDILSVLVYDTIAPPNTAYWFYGLTNCTEIDLNNLDVTYVESMDYMFYKCSNLTTIYSQMDWVQGRADTVISLEFVTKTFTNTFYGCTSLVGGSGTAYDSNYVAGSYAMVDGDPSYPGYLTGTKVAIAVYDETDNSLRFYMSSEEAITYNFNGGLNTEIYKGIDEATYSSAKDVPWYEYWEDITSVSVETTISPIGTAYWFYGFKNCAEMDLEKLDTSNVKDMNHMFYSCNTLANLDLNRWDTSSVTDMSYMFEDCSSLTSLDLSSWNTSNVTNMSSMFATSVQGSSTKYSATVQYTLLSNLSDLDLSGWDTSNVTNMSYMFYGCGLTALDLDDFDTGNVTNMSGMFSYCMNLITLDLAGFNTENVTNMSSMFLQCNCLEEIIMDNFSTDNVTNMNYMFDECSSLQNLDLSTFDSSNVANMAYMFYNCSSLRSLNLGSSFNTGSVTDMSFMFYNCSSLQNLDLSSFDTANVTNMANMFYNCSSLQTLDLSSFYTANVINMGNMFYDCSGLENLDLSNFDTSNVTNMSYMFGGCRYLKTIYVKADWDSDVANSTRMFYGCSSLTGGEGTTYSSSHTDATYARIDQGTTQPGYFTAK